MLCKVQIETPLGCYCLGGHSLTVWGYLKAIVSTVLFICLVVHLSNYLYYFEEFDGTVLCIMAILLLIDIVLHVKLVMAYLKKAEAQFSVYFKYTIVLWLTALIFGGMACVFNHFYPVDEFVFIGILIILVSAFIQTIICFTIMKQKANADVLIQPSPIFKADFTVQIVVPSTDKLIQPDDNS